MVPTQQNEAKTELNAGRALHDGHFVVTKVNVIHVHYAQ